MASLSDRAEEAAVFVADTPLVGAPQPVKAELARHAIGSDGPRSSLLSFCPSTRPHLDTPLGPAQQALVSPSDGPCERRQAGLARPGGGIWRHRAGGAADPTMIAGDRAGRASTI